jgi:hypothetical protein
MNDQRQITPTRIPILGPVIFVLIGLATVTIVCFVIQSRIPSQGSFDRHRQEMIPAGCVYGLVAAGCWLATAIDHRYARFVIRALIVIAASWLFGQLRDTRPWLQTIADFSGLAIAQCTIFFWLQVPAWRMGRPDSNRQQPISGNQFGIADIAIATLVVALLLALMIRYSPPIQILGYWLMSIAVWTGGAAVTMLLAKGMTSAGTSRTLLMLSLSLIFALSGTYAIGIADSIVDRGQLLLNEVESFAAFYGRIVWGYWITFAFFACFARIQSVNVQPQSSASSS